MQILFPSVFFVQQIVPVLFHGLLVRKSGQRWARSNFLIFHYYLSKDKRLQRYRKNFYCHLRYDKGNGAEMCPPLL